MQSQLQKIGLFFGSFNPVHTGHMIIANFMATQTDLNEVWMIVSPQNPLKPKNTLANDYDRLHLVQLAIGENLSLRVSDIEFGLPKPSYTIDTLTYMKEKYPDKNFVLIMGGDNLNTLPKWKNHHLLLNDYQIYVYKRPEYELGPLQSHPHIRVFDKVPLMRISASYIRKCLREEVSVEYLVPDRVYAYLEQNNLYKK